MAWRSPAPASVNPPPLISTFAGMDVVLGVHKLCWESLWASVVLNVMTGAQVPAMPHTDSKPWWVCLAPSSPGMVGKGGLERNPEVAQRSCTWTHVLQVVTPGPPPHPLPRSLQIWRHWHLSHLYGAMASFAQDNASRFYVPQDRIGNGLISIPPTAQ